MTNKDPSLSNALLDAVRGQLAQTSTASPGTIQGYDEESQKAGGKPTVCRKRRGSDGTVEDIAQPIAPNCPVVFPSGGGGKYGMTWPLEDGDPCAMVYADRDMDVWLSTGEDDSCARSERRHDSTDAFLFPGHRPFSAPLPSSAYATDALVIFGDRMLLGSSAASEALYLGSSYNAALNTYLSAEVTFVSVLSTATTVAQIAAAALIYLPAVQAFQAAVAANTFLSTTVFGE